MKTPSALDIAIIDDELVIRESLRDFLSKRGDQVRDFVSGASAIAAFARNPPDVALLDIRMPGEDGLDILRTMREAHPELAVIMMSGHGTMDSAIEAMRHGAADFLRKPVRLPDLLAALERTRRLMALEGDRNRLRATLAHAQRPSGGGGMVGYLGASEACREVLQFLKAAERTPFDGVLITGETGSGKEVIAHELHRRLRGEQAPFVVVNCPALPDNLVESELFGHMKGAFTGADSDHPGAFELADGGTLFLDELGDLALAAQAKLLRTLESRQVRRLGGRRDLAVAVTLIAATNQDLEQMVAAGSFRRDLLYRLNTYQLRLPPLRERTGDIPLLAEHFLRQFAARRHLPDLRFAATTLAALGAYHFPGNVRELRNLIERAVMLCDGAVITPDLLALPKAMPRPPDRRETPVSQVTALPTSAPAGPTDPEAQETLAVLVRLRWNRRQAAKELGISYEALRWRIAKHELSA